MDRQSESGTPESWIDVHGDALFRYAVMRVRNATVAEDLVQEAFLSALGSIQSFDGRSSERTWLIGILRHKIADHWRVKARTPDFSTVEAIDAPAERTERLQKWPTDPAQIYEQNEFWEVFDECTKKLPEAMADAYFLREIVGLTTGEICEELGLTSNSLAIRMHRARVALRDCLDRNWFHPK